MIKHFTPLTLGEKQRGVFSNEEEDEVCTVARSEAISKVKKLKSGAALIWRPRSSDSSAGR